MIVVAGEALIDMMPGTAKGSRSEFKAVPGGSPFNVAVALGRLECRPRFFCGFAEDAFSRILRERLQDSDVDLTYCLDAAGLTTLGFVSEGPQGTPEYAFYTSETAGCALTKEQLPAEFPNEVEAIHFGSFSLGVEPFGTALEVLCQRESSRRFISLDPNIRPFLVQDRATYLARLERFQCVADLIKTSEEDLAWTNPGLELQEFAQQHLAAGAGMVVVTRGEEGALGFCRQGHVTVPGEKVSVVDTVGAGDTFQATLLAGLAELGRLSKESIQNLQTSEMERLIRRAGHAAAINCSRQGCDPPSLEEIGNLA